MDIQKVFLSYSNQDRTIADRVRQFLEDRGIGVHFAPEDIPIGAPNWEDVIRAMIKSAMDGVVLVATPHSRSSPYVNDELRLAQELNRTIYPLWAGGDTFEDAVPDDLRKRQHCDVRGEQFDAGMRQFIMHFYGVVGPEKRIEGKYKEYLKDIQRKQKARIFRGFRDKIKAIWSNTQAPWSQRLLALPKLLDVCTDYLLQMSKFKQRWGDLLQPDTDALSEHLTRIVLHLQDAIRDGELSPIRKLGKITQYIGELLTLLENHWSGNDDGEIVDGSLGPRLPGE